MDLFSLFRPAQQTPAPQKTEGTSSSEGAGLNVDPNQPPPGTEGEGKDPGKVEGKETSPKGPSLDDFSTLWKNEPNQNPRAFSALNADPAKISEAAKKIDFARAVDPEQVKKALAGDTESFLAVLNTVAQQSFAVATQASSHLVDRQASAAVEFMRSELPGQIKSFSARENLLSENPAFTDPAVQPLVEAVQFQFAQKFPNASAADLNKAAKDYLQFAFGKIGAPSSENSGERSGTGNKSPRVREQQKKQLEGTFDWADHFGVGSSKQ